MVCNVVFNVYVVIIATHGVFPAMKIFIGMETSGRTRRAFASLGHDVISCDILPAQDDAVQIMGINSICTHDLYQAQHIVGDVFEALERLRLLGWWPDLAIFHPTCTFHTVSAAWAFNDPDYNRYPGVGYHQKVKPGTLTGQARREARDAAEADVRRIWALPIERVAIENPVGTLSTRWQKPAQIIQPYQFGDDASKATCLWLRGLPVLLATGRVAGRIVEWPRGSGKMVERWANQTDSGQNNAPPENDRWKSRSDTFPGISSAFASQWGELAPVTAPIKPAPVREPLKQLELFA